MSAEAFEEMERAWERLQEAHLSFYERPDVPKAWHLEKLEEVTEAARKYHQIVLRARALWKLAQKDNQESF